MRRLFIALTVLTLAGCATSRTVTVPPKDKELSRTSNIARAAFEDGATARAIDLYGKALNRAHAMDDATEIGDTAYNLAVPYPCGTTRSGERLAGRGQGSVRTQREHPR